MSTSQSNPFGIGSSIPVVRMLDEAKSKSFYVDFLGYSIDWEHRFEDSLDSPLYMQIRNGQSVLHLNGHADEQAPVCEVRIPVGELEKYCEHLCGKVQTGEKPTIVDPRYEGRPTDMNLIDPSGNMVVFWAESSSNSD